jgi:hypothetical protein
VTGVSNDLGEKGLKGRGLPAAAVGDEELQVELVLGDRVRGVGLHHPDRKRGRVSVGAILNARELLKKGSLIHWRFATAVANKRGLQEMAR